MKNHAWPAILWLVRHGESAGNVARLAAEQSGALTIEVEGRDVDVPLSPLGKEQSTYAGGLVPRSGGAGTPNGTALFALCARTANLGANPNRRESRASGSTVRR